MEWWHRRHFKKASLVIVWYLYFNLLPLLFPACPSHTIHHSAPPPAFCHGAPFLLLLASTVLLSLLSLCGPCRDVASSFSLTFFLLLSTEGTLKCLGSREPGKRFSPHKHTGCPTSLAVNPWLSEILLLVNSSTYRTQHDPNGRQSILY